MKPEQMRVYDLSEQLAAEVDRILSLLPFKARKIAEHLEKSNESVGFNLSEGLTAFKPRIKASCFDIARRETGEIRKALRRIVRKRMVAPHETYKADSLANSMIGMLTRMIKQQEDRERDAADD